MKKFLFYKWYGLLVAIILQGAFLYLYYALEIYDRTSMQQGIFIGVYQLIFIVAAVHYVMLFRAYQDFEEMKRRQAEENEMTGEPVKP